MDKETIISIINIIQKSKVNNKDEYYSNEYSDFKKKYPVLFKMACEEKLDFNTLNTMLNMLDRMKNNNISQYDASAEIGTLLFSKYVEPLVPVMKKKDTK